MTNSTFVAGLNLPVVVGDEQLPLRGGLIVDVLDTPLFAQDNGFSHIVLAVVFGLMGEGLTRTTVKMRSLRRRLRFAAGTLGVLTGCVTVVYFLATDTIGGSDGLLACVVAAAMVAIWSGLFWYCGVCVLAFLYQHVLAPPFRSLSRRNTTARAARRPPPLPPPDPRIKKDAEARKADAQRRRTDARASALLTFSVFAPRLGTRFTKAMFDQYVQDFMSDQFSADDVERRGRELAAILERHAQEAQPIKQPRTLPDLAKWFEDQKARIEAVPLDERLKRTQLIALRERYSELAAKLLEDIEP